MCAARCVKSAVHLNRKLLRVLVNVDVAEQRQLSLLDNMSRVDQPGCKSVPAVAVCQYVVRRKLRAQSPLEFKIMFDLTPTAYCCLSNSR